MKRKKPILQIVRDDCVTLYLLYKCKGKYELYKYSDIYIYDMSDWNDFILEEDTNIEYILIMIKSILNKEVKHIKNCAPVINPNVLPIHVDCFDKSVYDKLKKILHKYKIDFRCNEDNLPIFYKIPYDVHLSVKENE